LQNERRIENIKDKKRHIEQSEYTKRKKDATLRDIRNCNFILSRTRVLSSTLSLLGKDLYPGKRTANL